MGSNAEYGHHKAMERIAALEAQLSEAKAGWDSSIADLREAAKICAEVEAQLAACQWRPITAEDLPKLGDEITRVNFSYGNQLKYGKQEVSAFDAIRDASELTVKEWHSNRWTHFRPINPPPKS